MLGAERALIGTGTGLPRVHSRFWDGEHSGRHGPVFYDFLQFWDGFTTEGGLPPTAPSSSAPQGRAPQVAPEESENVLKTPAIEAESLGPAGSRKTWTWTCTS